MCSANSSPGSRAQEFRRITYSSAAPVTGVQNRFQVPLLDGIRIVDEAKGLQNGFGKGVRYAMSHPRGKIEIIGTLPRQADNFQIPPEQIPRGRIAHLHPRPHTRQPLARRRTESDVNIILNKKLG